MAGHSNASNVKKTKDANNRIKAKLYTVLGREIRSAVSQGGPDPDTNSKLRNAIARARSMGLPKDNISRALQPCSANEIFESIIYEGYWQNAAIIISAQTNNRARTGPEIKSVLAKMCGCIADVGSALFLFENIGMCILRSSQIKLNKDQIEDIALLECDACDIFEEKSEDSDIDACETLLVVCFDVLNFISGSEKLTEALSKHAKSENFIENSFIGYKACTKVSVHDDKIENFYKLINALDELDDVINVFHNVC